MFGSYIKHSYIISEPNGENMIFYKGQKIDSNTDQQVIWKMIVKEQISIPEKLTFSDSVTNKELIEAISVWINENDESMKTKEFRI